LKIVTPWYEDGVGVFSNPNALVAASKGMQAVKPGCNKILWFLTGVSANIG